MGKGETVTEREGPQSLTLQSFLTQSSLELRYLFPPMPAEWPSPG